MPKKEPSPLEILKDQVGEIARHQHLLTESIAVVREKIGKVEGQLEGERRLHQSKQRNWTTILLGVGFVTSLVLWLVDRVGRMLGWWG